MCASARVQALWHAVRLRSVGPPGRARPFVAAPPMAYLSKPMYDAGRKPRRASATYIFLVMPVPIFTHAGKPNAEGARARSRLAPAGVIFALVGLALFAY